MSTRADDDLAALIAGARRAANVTLLVGLSVAAIVILFVSLGADFLFGSEPGARPPSLFIIVPALAAIPMIIGFPILIGAALRLHALRTLDRQPERLVATELAQRLGQPALRFCFASGGITIVTGERDRDALSDAARARARTP